ncbi:EI24 domain-containing protein [Demequina sp. TTPB684]|uniref:EI24 domain-containing protein n=1 Tax=unclassified Demequina TaxID=2620311 RepID=UPI001CF469F2|nr:MULTISPECIES: EI24 domain-containing protein [unclassified Demequina]MCB2413802.1 EI24 domain-containing protein [Demequina sp. TTPB684]UPU89290.1 EI24 domain-containing protein [Demequina sp. TMPB413]
MRVLSEFAQGVGLYWRGVRTWSADPKLMALGLLPGVITMAVFLTLLLALVWALPDATAWIADALVGERSDFHGIVQWAAGFALVGAGVLLAVYTFVTVTSVVGQPFFERIAHRVDERLGPVPEAPAWPWWRNAARGVGEGARLMLLTVPLSIGLFAVGIVPGVGTLASWIGGALLGGWFVALEFTAIPFERRGLVLRDRRRILASRRARTLGFGAMAFVMSALPPLAVLSMPSAVAGGALLARRALDEAESASTNG